MAKAGKVSGRTAFDAMRAGDAVATEVVNTYLHYLAQGLSNIINIFQPEVLSIGGGISNEGDSLLETPGSAHPCRGVRARCGAGHKDMHCRTEEQRRHYRRCRAGRPVNTDARCPPTRYLSVPVSPLRGARTLSSGLPNYSHSPVYRLRGVPGAPAYCPEHRRAGV